METSRQRTSDPRVYAAGDVVPGLNQIAVAMGQGEIPAVDIHNICVKPKAAACRSKMTLNVCDGRGRLSYTPRMSVDRKGMHIGYLHGDRR